MENESTTDFRPLILVAEDDDSNFKLIKAIIGKKCDILWAKNGEEIVKLFNENRGKAAAILMDIKIPIMISIKVFIYFSPFSLIKDSLYSFMYDRK